MKIKLKDLTPEQYRDWHKNNCNFNCPNCIFFKVPCIVSGIITRWINNKDLYSDKFLNQEIEVENNEPTK